MVPDFLKKIYLEDYIKLIHDKFLRRSLIKLGYEIINSAYVTNISLESILSDLEVDIFNITNQIKIQKINWQIKLRIMVTKIAWYHFVQDANL